MDIASLSPASHRSHRSWLRLTWIMLLLLSISSWGICPVSASGGPAPADQTTNVEQERHFSIQPSFASPYDAHPRGYFVYNNPDSKLNDSVYVTNDGSVRGTIHLYPTDASTSETSGTTLLDESSPRRDVGSWITLSQSEVTLDPGESQEVPFTVKVPKKVRPGQHGGGIVANLMQDQHRKIVNPKDTINIRIRSLIGLGVLINLPGKTSEQLLANSVHYDETSDYQRLLIGLQNNGTQLLYPKGEVQIVDDQGKKVQQIPVNMRTFLPQTSIHYPVYVQDKGLEGGKTYTAKIHLTYGHNQHLDYVAKFYVPVPNHGSIINQLHNLVLALKDSDDPFSHLPLWGYMALTSITLFLLGLLILQRKKLVKLTKAMTARPHFVSKR